MKLNDGRCSFTLARTIHSCYVSMVLDCALTVSTYFSAFDCVRYSRDDKNFVYLLFFVHNLCIWFLFTVALCLSVIAMRNDQLFDSAFISLNRVTKICMIIEGKMCCVDLILGFLVEKSNTIDSGCDRE